MIDYIDVLNLDSFYNSDWKSKDLELYNAIKSYIELPMFNWYASFIQSCEEVHQVKYELRGRKFNNFVEIGSFQGGSLYVYYKLFCNINANVTAMEIKVSDALRLLMKHIPTAKIVEGDAKQNISQVNDIDLLHMDSLHEYNSLKEDFDIFYPKVIDGGVILIHDTLLYDGAIAFRKELESKFECKTFKSYNDESCGITMLIKR